MTDAPLGTLHIPAVVARHGVIVVQEVLANLYTVKEQSERPDWFEPNDIGSFESILQRLQAGQANGYDDPCWLEEPFRFFVGDLTNYLLSTPDLPTDDQVAIVKALRGYHIYWAIRQEENNPEYKGFAIRRSADSINRLPNSGVKVVPLSFNPLP